MAKRRVTDSARRPSGDHYAAQGAGPIRPGFYGPDSAAAPGGWVHNLEHGYVVVLYRGSDGVPEDTLAALRRFADAAPQTESAAACGYSSKIVSLASMTCRRHSRRWPGIACCR